MLGKITRRALLAGTSVTAIVNAAFARHFGGGAISTPQAITGISLSGTTFLGGAGSAGSTIGTATVTLSPSSPPASGIVWSITGTDAARFLINSSTGVLTVGASDQAVGSYSINVTATNAAYTGSPSSLGSPWTITGVSAGLTVNQNSTRPIGINVAGAPTDYPYSNIIAAVSGGPANTTDHLQFWSSGTGYVGSPWYLNNSTTPPVSGVSSASGLTVPSVPAFSWNPSGSNPPTPVTSWELRFVNGVTSAVISSQPITVDILNGRDQAGALVHGRLNIFPVISAPVSDGNTLVMVARFTGAGVTGGGSTCPIVAGASVGTAAVNSPTGSPYPLQNSMIIQFTVDDVPIGPLVTGPQVLGDFQTTATLDTTGLTDGTHCLGIILVDHIGGSAATFDLPYYFRCVQQPFIVHNTGTSLATLYAGAQVIPSIDRGFGPSTRINSSKADFVTFPGFTAIAGTGGTHNTIVPVPAPQSGFNPPFSDSSSPYHGQSAAQQRNASNFWTEGIGGNIPQEYCTTPRFFTTLNGGVYAYGLNTESRQTVEGDYQSTIRDFNYDGLRNDNQTDPISSSIDGHDGTYWVVFELFGRIIKQTFDGAVVTMAGGTTDRTKLGLCVDDNTYTEAQIDPFLIQVGTIGSPSFGDLRGINDGCWDLTDTPGNTLIVANPIDHWIVRITGLLSGPVTMVRIAGQDGGLNGAAVSTVVSDNGGLVDGSATEFIAGSSVAIFNGTVTGNVLTVNSGFSGTLVPGCPLSWSGNLNTATGNMVLAHVSGAGNGSTWSVNFASSGGAQSMTASTPVAQFAGPYSVKMADGVHGPDPLGTLYIADYQNSAIRKIHYAGSHVWDTVSTICGNQTAALKWNTAPGAGANVGVPLNSAPNDMTVTISSATWSGGVLTVATSTPVVWPGVISVYGTIQPYWTITLAGLTNTGSGGTAAVTGNFQVLAVTNNQHFTLTMPAGAGVIGTLGNFGTATVQFWSDDVYLPSNPAARPLSTAYCPLPQRVVINSTGKLVIGHTWFDAVSTIDLAAATFSYTGQLLCDQPNTRLRIGGSRPDNSPFGVDFQISWFQIDVDSGVAGDVSATGCIGPKDDVLMLDANGTLESTYWRCAADGTSPQLFASNDMVPRYLLPNGRQGGGHYDWMIGISRHQARMLTSGVSDTGINGWRSIIPAHGDFFPDPPSFQFADGSTLVRGATLMLTGSPVGTYLGDSGVNGIFPWGTRPGIVATHGENYRSELGLPGHSDSFDALQATMTTDSVLGEYIKNGGGSTVPAPEFSIGGDDLGDILYTIRRSSIQGSIPGGTAGGGFTPVTPLVQRVPFATDVTPPVISAVSAARTGGGATTIHMTWTTDKPTWGIVCAGFASAHGTTVPYHLFGREAFVAGTGNPSYGTSHSVTIQCYQDVTTYLVVIVKDIAGNNAVSPEQTVAA